MAIYTRLLKNLGKPYMHGNDVLAVQTELKRLGFFNGSLGGNYGPITKAAVRAYQKAKKLKVDGIVGPITWGALFPSVADDSAAGDFISYSADQEGCLYVWGGQGQQMTPELIKRLENSTRNYKRAIALYNEHVEKGLSLIGYDCSGLVIKYLLDKGQIKSDTTANGIYFNLCSAIERTDLKAGNLVFKKYRTKNKMYHVGVYMGDGTVVHAKGRDDGVVRESINATSWNRYGRLKVWGEEPTQRIYEVKRGDSLYSIAKNELGRGSRWQELYDLNKDVIGNNPSLLRLGIDLVLPER